MGYSISNRRLDQTQNLTVGVFALARPTFDLELARETFESSFGELQQQIDNLVGSVQLLTSPEEVSTAIAQVEAYSPDRIIVWQTTFSDSSMVTQIAEAFPGVPLTLWAVREPRTGERLRLNSFCGINLAGFALTANHTPYNWIYTDSDHPQSNGILSSHLENPQPQPPDQGEPYPRSPDPAVEECLQYLSNSKVGVIGKHPDGFEPCSYDRNEVKDLCGTKVDTIPLPHLFDTAGEFSDQELNPAEELSERLEQLDQFEQEELQPSYRLYAGLDKIVAEREWKGVAMRCWPECFTEFNGAACSPLSWLSERGVVGCCEADLYGVLTGLALSHLATSAANKENAGKGSDTTGEIQAAWVADLVDIDPDDNTGVFWHCGLAPITMADTNQPPQATVHSNRKLPLLNQFTLRPGRITIGRLSQHPESTRMVIGGGEILQRPPAFSGTSGVVRFDAPADLVLDRIMYGGLEHHYGIVYGDIRSELAALAHLMNIPVYRLT